MARNTDRLPRLLQVGVVGAVASAAVNLALYGASRAADVSFAFIYDGKTERIASGEILGLSFIGFGAGVIVAAIALLLGRPSLRAVQVFGGVVAVVSLFMVFDADELSTSGAVVLGVMHIVSGIAYIAALEVLRRSPRTESAPEVSAAASTA